MKKIYGPLFFALSLVFVSVVPADAHHSASSEFDMNKSIPVTGVLTKVDWVNPHAYMHLDVKDATGKTINWDIELAGLSKLRLSGLAKQSLAVGQTYRVYVSPDRQGRHAGLVNIIMFPDGHVYRLGLDAAQEGAAQ
jgi:hypothetical protein